jgi:hypothetical protein
MVKGKRRANREGSMATLLKNLGVPPRDTMEILGHARIAVTMEIYTSADGTSRRGAPARWVICLTVSVVFAAPISSAPRW